ncbi:MAG: glycosyltransferase [Christensenellaceae bacterium]
MGNFLPEIYPFLFLPQSENPRRIFARGKKATEGLKAFRPDVVFSKGGYVALPVVFAAKN